MLLFLDHLDSKCFFACLLNNIDLVLFVKFYSLSIRLVKNGELYLGTRICLHAMKKSETMILIVKMLK